MIDKDEIIFCEPFLSPKQCKDCVFAVSKYPYGEQWEKLWKTKKNANID